MFAVGGLECQPMTGRNEETGGVNVGDTPKSIGGRTTGDADEEE